MATIRQLEYSSDKGLYSLHAEDPMADIKIQLLYFVHCRDVKNTLKILFDYL
jgi:hypothetical protein